MKIRNSLAILCSAAFCFTLALAGCNQKGGGQGAKDTWTVTFNSMGGSEVAPVEVKNGETVEKPADPTKANYTFKQWCEDEAGVTPFDFATPITTNWTLFATWTPGGGGGGGGGGGDIVPPDPTVYPYYVTIGSNTTGLSQVDKDAGDPSNLVAKYKASVASVTAGDQITFTNGQEPIRPGSDAEDATNKNNKNGSWENGFTIHNDATNVEVWLKEWGDGYSFWITGYDAGSTPEPGKTPHGPEGSSHVSWYLVGQGSFVTDSWSIAGGVQLWSNPNSDTDKGCVLDITFEVGDKFKVTDGNTWFGYEKIDTYASPNNKGLTNFEGTPDGFNGQNIECTVAGVYNIYVNSAGTYWIEAA
ncbi:MAG: InlB B-repeat-containing protein [Bacilli bacterium]|nr:InlB B-repeat-containing protein [Bacilli bacterium]